jgi:hypothetical protein
MREQARSTLEHIKSIPLPARTRSYSPVGHLDLIGTLKDLLERNDFSIKNENYSLDKTGQKMFGTFILNEGITATDDKLAAMSYMVGFRNSYNKTMAVGIAAGTHVFICSNGAITGEFLEFRKHTSGLTPEELYEVALSAVERLEPTLKGFQAWHLGLRGKELSDRDMQTLTFRAVEQGVLPAGRFAKFYQILFEKDTDIEEKYPNDLFGFHGSMTHLWRDNSLLGTGPRNKGLVRLIKEAESDLKQHDKILTKEEKAEFALTATIEYIPPEV